MPTRSAFPSLALAACLVPVASSATAASPSTFEGQTSVVLVEIPVEVERRGEPVRSLDAADFAVTSGETTLPIVAFEPIDLEPGRTSPRVPRPAARRNLFFLFDFAFTRPPRLATAVAAARELVASGLDPSDLVGVGLHLPNGQLPVLLQLTLDRAAAERALAALADVLAGKKLDATETPDPLRLTGSGVPALLLQRFQTDTRNTPSDILSELAMGPDGKRGAPDLQYNILSHSAIALQPSVEARQRADLRVMADGFGELAALLRSVRGRKLLMLMSSGPPVELATGINAGVQAFGTGGGADLLAHVDAALSALRADGWLIHAVDLAGTARGSLVSDSSLLYFARETGGEVVQATNDFAKGMGGALEASLHGYLLTVEASGVAMDGALHPLAVRLRDAGRGVRLRHREGFRGPLPFEEREAASRLAEAAGLVATGEERDDLGVAVAVVPLGPTPGSATTQTRRVSIVVEVPGAGLLGELAGKRGLEVYGYALDAAGRSRDHFGYGVDLEASEVAGRLAEGGVHVLGDLDLEPGQYGVRILVRDRRDGRITLRTLPIEVGAAAPDRLDALFLAEGGEPWLWVPAGSESFVVRGRALRPATRATLAVGGEAQLVLLGSGIVGGQGVVSSRVVDAAGKPVVGGRLELLAQAAGDGGEPDLVVGRLWADALPPGDYVLEVRLAGIASRASMRPFRVVAAPT